MSSSEPPTTARYARMMGLKDDETELLEALEELRDRDACLDCARKHVGKAKAKWPEGPLGYPRHGWYVAGELAEAEDELVREHPDLAARIREFRLALQDSLNAATRVAPDDALAGLTLDVDALAEPPFDVIMDALCHRAAVEGT